MYEMGGWKYEMTKRMLDHILQANDCENVGIKVTSSFPLFL